MSLASTGAGGQEDELARARASMFGLVARVFSGRPTEGLLDGIRDSQMLESLSAFDVVFEEDFLETDIDQLVGDLAGEFVRLFIGPGHHIAPYESVYVRSEDEDSPRLWGKATVEVANFYLEAGLELPTGQTPDHLGLELEAMAVLAEAEAVSRETGDLDSAKEIFEMQNEFCRQHLRIWVPKICSEIGNETASSFYRNMALLTASLVEMQCGADSVF
ncbi:MAG: molecular chaperone TorD family protein [Thermoleophilia bacterium]